MKYLLKRNSVLQTGAALTSLVLLGACSFSDASRVEEDFGSSVRQMVQAQIYDLDAAHEPAINGPDVLDGTVGEAGIVVYQESASSDKGKKVEK